MCLAQESFINHIENKICCYCESTCDAEVDKTYLSVGHHMRLRHRHLPDSLLGFWAPRGRKSAQQEEFRWLKLRVGMSECG